MNIKNARFYGIDRHTYQECMDQIRATNRKHAEILNVWFLCMNTFFLVCSIFNQFGVDKRSTGHYLRYLILSVILEVCLFAFRRFTERYSLVLVYLSILIFVAFGVSASISQPFLTATTFLVLVVLVAFSYIDTLDRIAGILVVSSIIFIWYSFEKKPRSIAYQDMYNILIYLSLALVLHYTFQRARMQQFITFQKNLQIKRELEVKSSFDALTSLLNRGRFFSMASEVLKQSRDEYMVICLLDLDSFKQINDKLGHQMGDKAIQVTGSTILNTLQIDLSDKWSFPERAVDQKLCFAGRLGGDEFIVMIRGAKSREEIIPKLEAMLKALNGVKIGELNGIHASFGVTEIANEERDMDMVYKRADEALYQSKRAGKNQITFG